MSSAPGLKAREAAGDDLCLRFFTESGEFTDSELRGVCAWWNAARTADEFLVPFLIRKQVFHPRALEEISLMERGYVSFSTIHHLFLPGGLDHLRKELLPHMPKRPSPGFLTQTIRDIVNSDTVRMRGQKSDPARAPEAIAAPVVPAEPASRDVANDDSDDQPAPTPARSRPAATKPAAPAKAAPPAAAAARRAPAKPAAAPAGKGRVGAREPRAPQTLEETLEILGAGELEMDGGGDLSETGVRHLRVEVQKNTPFSRLLERLSERVRKP